MRTMTESERALLLEIARRSLEDAVERGAVYDPDAAALVPGVTSPAAAFVTLRNGEELRGCIGLMRFDEPVWLNVRDAAPAAALEDGRFPPVRAHELPGLTIEISVLAPPVPLADPADFVPGLHGIIAERGGHRGLLLPQVAPEMGWGAAQMLDGVCRKAGLPGDAWRDPQTRLYVFESFCFSEGEREGEEAGD